jgi:hypothetical protein
MGMERIGLTANKSSSPRVEGRSELGVAEVGGVWWCWNRRRAAAEGDDGGDEDGERSTSSADGEWLASSAPSVSGAQRRRPAPLSWFCQQICHRGRCMAVCGRGEHGGAIRDGGSTSLPSFRSRNGGETLRAAIIHYMATSARLQ